MSFYRTLLAAVAAVAIASPVFADDTNGAMQQQNPSATQQPMTSSAADQQGANDTKININKANVKGLMKVKGMNASRAKAIVAYRKKHGEFKSTDDLTNVAGFKKLSSARLKMIQNQLTAE